MAGDPAMDALRNDQRVVLVLDAGGTGLRFDAIQGGRALLVEPPTLPSFGDDLARCLAQIRDGFAATHAATGRRAVALSLAFPGPADYRRGIIGDLPNLTGFRGGVPLGPMLAAAFGLPAYINNDGALFAYGEALGGLLPFVNDRLAAAGSPRRFRNLLGVTLGTGFGGGIVIDGRLVVGDNSAAGQIWMLRHRDDRGRTVEEGVSIRAVRRVYAEAARLAAGAEEGCDADRRDRDRRCPRRPRGRRRGVSPARPGRGRRDRRCAGADRRPGRARRRDLWGGRAVPRRAAR